MKNIIAAFRTLLKKFYDSDLALRKRLIKQGAKVGHHLQVVDGLKFLYEPWFAALIEIGDNVVISAGVRFVSHDSAYANVFGDLPVKFGKIIIGNNSYIGVNSIILCNVTIGENCIIGAGSVVNRDIPPNTIAAGNPARVVSGIEAGLNKFKERLHPDSNDGAYYIDFGGSNKQIKHKFGANSTSAIVTIFHDYFKALKQFNS
jgi:acetyltransferase-like isoleucine patch superfamily enzyme